MSLTDQELELAALLHEADEAYVAEFCQPDSAQCTGPDSPGHIDQARALLALGMRVPHALDTAGLDWRDTR